jgi:hypothetical protein
MKKNFLLTMLTISFLSITASGLAQTATPKVTKRQVNQQERIGQGVNSGELTPRETAHLEGREVKIQDDKKAAKADGTVTASERAKLNREENRTSRAIYRQKHDAQTRK